MEKQAGPGGWEGIDRMSYIVCKDVAFSYENQIVVSGLSFQVDAGDYLCIIGENGTGKTTLMKGLLGLKKPSGGTRRSFAMRAAIARPVRRRCALILRRDERADRGEQW